MNILMMTNTYSPHVGGVARSVSNFTNELRGQGHRVVVVAPEYDGATQNKDDDIRVPAIQHFSGSDFSMILPIPGGLHSHLENFKPDVVHSHHPFLIGSTAVRISTQYHVPLVYTQHTMHEEYTHYVPTGFSRLKPFVVSLSIGYANMCDQVIAPSKSTEEVLRERGVTVPMEVVPTGVESGFENGDGKKIRDQLNIGRDAFVVGHIGRLAPEKNLEFLARSIAAFLKDEQQVHFVVAGYGPSEDELTNFFADMNLSRQVHFLGKLENQDLIDAFHAMDVFAFSSKSETQGLVLVEAMTAGVPVVALDAAGVREVVRDGINGFLLHNEEQESFVKALKKICHASEDSRKNFCLEARNTTMEFTTKKCTAKLLSVYEKVQQEHQSFVNRDESIWQRSMEQMKVEWELLGNLTTAIGDAIHNGNGH